MQGRLQRWRAGSCPLRCLPVCPHIAARPVHTQGCFLSCSCAQPMGQGLGRRAPWVPCPMQLSLSPLLGAGTPASLGAASDSWGRWLPGVWTCSWCVHWGSERPPPRARLFLWKESNCSRTSLRAGVEGRVKYTCGCAVRAGGQQPGRQGMGPTCPTFLVLTEPGWGRAAWLLLPLDRTQSLPMPYWACLAQNPALCFSYTAKHLGPGRGGAGPRSSWHL